MKKALSLMLVIAMMLTLCACGSSGKKTDIEDITPEDLEAAAAELMGEEFEEEPVAETEAVEKIYQLGETIPVLDGKYEFTIHDFAFSEDSLYGAREQEGNIHLSYTATLNCVEDVKEVTQLILPPGQIIYNDDYTFYYTGPEVNGNPENRGNMAVFEPLSDNKTREIIGEDEVSKVLAEDTEGKICYTFEFWENNTSRSQKVTIQFR